MQNQCRELRTQAARLADEHQHRNTWLFTPRIGMWTLTQRGVVAIAFLRKTECQHTLFHAPHQTDMSPCQR